MNTDKIRELEEKIIREMLKFAIGKGYLVSVFDGEEYPVKCSANIEEIIENAMSVDEATLTFRDAETRNTIGKVLLVFGNDGWDVIADHSDNLATREIVASTDRLTAEHQ